MTERRRTKKIAVTKADREWLRYAAAIVLGAEKPTKLARRKTAQNLERIAHRADLANQDRGEMT